MSAAQTCAVVCLAGALLGCASARPTCKIPDTVKLELESSDRVNVDERGRSLPTIVRVYQLTEIDKLQESSFEDVWERDKDALGATIVKRDELTLYPGQVALKRLKRESSADFLVAVAVFRTPIGSAWRTIQEWPLAGDPCSERNDKRAAPILNELRVRLFLENYRIESVNNYVDLPKRRCSAGKRSCSGGLAPDELPEERREGRLRTFEEDSSDPDLGTYPQREEAEP